MSNANSAEHPTVKIFLTVNDHEGSLIGTTALSILIGEQVCDTPLVSITATTFQRWTCVYATRVDIQILTGTTPVIINDTTAPSLERLRQ